MLNAELSLKLAYFIDILFFNPTYVSLDFFLHYGDILNAVKNMLADFWYAIM